MKTQVRAKVLVLIALLSTPVQAQRKAERPRLHSDFYFGSSAASREALQLMEKEQARLLLVGFHQGWDIPRIAREMKTSADELNVVYDELASQRLAGSRSSEYEEPQPFIPVIRERDVQRLRTSLDRHAREFAATLESRWVEIESMATALSGAKDIPKQRLMYKVVVSGVLFGGMEEAFFADKTLLPPGPRRARDQRFYAWLVEGDPALAGVIKRESRESGGYTIVSIGKALPKERPGLEEIRAAGGMILEDADARRFRTFIALLCRDHLLPFFKNNRQEFFTLAGQIESAKYIARAEFFGWYYNQIANMVADQLSAAGRVAPPAEYDVYALKSPLR